MEEKTTASKWIFHYPSALEYIFLHVEYAQFIMSFRK